MPEPDSNRDLDALVNAMEENREELKKMQQRVETLDAAIQALKASRLESDRKRGKRGPN